MERDNPRDPLWLLAGAMVLGIGAVFLFGTQEGRRVRRQIASWTEEAQQRLAKIQQVLEATRQLCEGELPGDARDSPIGRLRVVRGS